MKTGLVLEGGAMRGMFTAGVMDVLMENGVNFDGVIGVSAGAAFGCNYKSKQIGRVIRYNTRFCADKRYGGLGSPATFIIRIFAMARCHWNLTPLTLPPTMPTRRNFTLSAPTSKAASQFTTNIWAKVTTDLIGYAPRLRCRLSRASLKLRAASCWTAALPIRSPCGTFSPSATTAMWWC